MIKVLRKDIKYKLALSLGTLLIAIATAVYVVGHGVGGDFVNTKGVIVDITSYGNNQYSTSVRYDTPNGAVISNIAYYESNFKTGDSIDIAYNKKDTGIVKYVDGNTKLITMLWVCGFILFGAGIIKLMQLKIDGYTSKSGIIVNGRVSEIVKVMDKENEYYAVIVAENPLTNAIIEIRSTPTYGRQYTKNQEVKVKFDVKTNRAELLDT